MAYTHPAIQVRANVIFEALRQLIMTKAEKIYGTH